MRIVFFFVAQYFGRDVHLVSMEGRTLTFSEFVFVAQYFGGDVHLVSMEGYGTDVFIRLDDIGNVLETYVIYICMCMSR